ncbi:hypothetical protein Thiofri_03719 [Thiorhodovibrio frisius]|nr:hypothetical protein Thiofri_03719 [Thiorhodovibrio frisius]
MRKSIETSASFCADHGLSDWRQSAYNIRCLKKAYRLVQQRKRSTSKDEDEMLQPKPVSLSPNRPGGAWR